MRRTLLIAATFLVVLVALEFLTRPVPIIPTAQAAYSTDSEGTFVGAITRAAERKGQRIVWLVTGPRVGNAVVAVQATPLAFDPDDIGRHLQDIRNANTRREVQAVITAHRAALADPLAAELAARQALGQISSLTGSPGDPRHDSLNPLTLDLARRLTAPGSVDQAVNGFLTDLQTQAPSPTSKPIDDEGGGCKFGEPCPDGSCLTVINTSPILCSDACINCKPAR